MRKRGDKKNGKGKREKRGRNPIDKPTNQHNPTHPPGPTQLHNKPKGSAMEMTGTGINIKGEKKRGRDTSAPLQIDEIEIGVYTCQADMTKKKVGVKVKSKSEHVASAEYI